MEDIDIDFGNQNRQQVLQKYTNALKHFRNYAERTYHLRPYLFDNYILFHYFHQRQQRQHFRNINKNKVISASSAGTNPESWTIFLKLELLNHILDRRRQILYWLFYILLLLLCVFVYRYESSTSLAERSVQSILYPGMRIWRRLTLPLIQRFPRLTEFYDESCLMMNPFFQADHLSCKLCAQVEGVLQIDNDSDLRTLNKQHFNIKSKDDNDDPIKSSANEHVPFTFKNNHTTIDLIDFYKIYTDNRDIFQRDAFRVQSTHSNIKNLDQLFIEQINYTNAHKQSHTLWRCNRMLPARLLRKLIPRPHSLPNSLAMERFITIDTPQAPSYALPDTDCPNVYIQQTLGARFIMLRPTSECRQSCRTLSIRLSQAFVLSYNWWYWRPISAPDSVSDTLSISLIGSYC